MSGIPQGVANLDSDEAIPQSAAELPEGVEGEVVPYIISFAKYNDDLCEIEGLGKNKGKKALSILRDIGTKVYTRADFKRNNITNDPVANAGEYKKIFSGLPTETELRELRLQGTGRIFYFDIESDRTMFVVAVRENHFETKKVRR